MGFEFDEFKSRANKAKHGVDFLEAQALWDDPALVEVPARSDTEPRFLIVGVMGGKHWSAFVTYRDKSIRVISVRRSRPEEVAIYENE